MIDLLLKNYQDKINMRLDMLITESSKEYRAVVSSARYSLLAGGKRIRPIILLEFYKLFGGDDDCAYNFACALEMIHTYSLIHDDLPCMDNDDLRRGKPANHIKYGESLALLAGDALLTESFGVAARTMGINPEYVAKALSYMSANAGISGMIGGQVIDTCFEGELDGNVLKEMYLLKTGALLKTAAVCGAVLAGADDEKVKLCEKYAENLGLAFQIIDDILDCTADEEKLGKSIGSDEKNNKVTFVSLYGLEKCKETAKELTRKAMDILDLIGGNTETIKAITDYLLNREY